MRQYDKMKKYKIRERVAQLKDFFMSNKDAIIVSLLDIFMY